METMPRDASGEWEDTLDWFEDALSSSKSAATIAAYREAADQLGRWLREQGDPDPDPTLVTSEQVEGFLGWLRDTPGVRTKRPPSRATLRMRYAGLRAFFDFLIRKEQMAVNPVKTVEQPVVPEQETEFVTSIDVHALLGACYGSTFEDKRDKAIITLLIETGMRRGALISMRLSQLDLKNRTATVLSKGGRTVQIRISRRSSDALHSYLRLRRRHWVMRKQDPELMDVLWLAQKGAMTGDGVYQMLERRAKIAGLERRPHPHELRHAWAHFLKLRGVSDEVLMTLGDWRDVKSMQRYGRSARKERAFAVADQYSYLDDPE